MLCEYGNFGCVHADTVFKLTTPTIAVIAPSQLTRAIQSWRSRAVLASSGSVPAAGNKALAASGSVPAAGTYYREMGHVGALARGDCQQYAEDAAAHCAVASAQDKEEQLREELRAYMAANDGKRPPARHSLYTKLRRANLLALLEERLLETEEQKESRLREELSDHLRNNDGQRPSRTSALYIKLQKSGLLHLLERNVRETEEQKEARLREELALHLSNNDGQRPSCTSALYIKLQKSGLLHLLEQNVPEAEEQKEARLREELALHLSNNAGQRPLWTSALYIKLQKAELLHLLEQSVFETEEKKEARLREELALHLSNNDGQRPSSTSSLYLKFKRAGLLHVLPRTGFGIDTAALDAVLLDGVLKFLAGKTVLDCLPYVAEFEEKSLQRYAKDVVADRRCFFVDVIVSVTRGLESAVLFSMQALPLDEQNEALQWLDSLPCVAADDTLSLRTRVLDFF
eukprot:s119_g14.t1